MSLYLKGVLRGVSVSASWMMRIGDTEESDDGHAEPSDNEEEHQLRSLPDDILLSILVQLPAGERRGCQALPCRVRPWSLRG